ncbi:hypothetical protein PR202_gb23522 [Eleusine coracana subsp. coracana]|uniref:Uncharacterized protein n=1 Tax=Eleusine coracana subsp. coracana TaxID=191504 RepID=A0AAV5FGD9_ELECO|nr:hypothetical protein PR202_gb23522 [Eleusine coracana subsp. coracana]
MESSHYLLLRVPNQKECSLQPEKGPGRSPAGTTRALHPRRSGPPPVSGRSRHARTAPRHSPARYKSAAAAAAAARTRLGGSSLVGTSKKRPEKSEAVARECLVDQTTTMAEEASAPAAAATKMGEADAGEKMRMVVGVDDS